MFGIEFDAWIFAHLRLWVIGVLALFVGTMELWKSYLPATLRRRSKRLKGFNWIFVGLTFLSMELLQPYIPLSTFRAWLRLAMFVVVISEVGYHSNVLPDVVGFAKDKVYLLLKRVGRGTVSRLFI